MRRFPLALGLVLAAAPVLAEDVFPHGRIRYVEPGVTLQRATETAAEEAVRNLPFLPGDRVWTDAGGRVEFQFAGSLLRVDRRGKLDYVAHDEGREERVVLRLWAGTLSLRTPDRRIAFEIETPGGLVETRDRGVYRVDTDSWETRLSVFEGEASLDSGRRRVEVEAGERTFARRGEPPDSPRRFDRGETDEFAAWERERDEREAWAGDSQRYLPDDLDPYAGEFDANGSWYHESEVGYVWRPYVAAGWRPYWNGRWAWTPYGWTWIPHEPWGWAPFHYGRWGFSGALGWYWIPDRVWGPAWVSWAIGSDYVGWCPLGYRDRLLNLGDRNRGHAVTRGTPVATGSLDPWIYVRRGDLGRGDVARRRIEVSPTEARDLRLVDPLRSRPTRDLRVVDEPAAPRTVRTKPYPGDTVPELRTDPATTIPFPIPRRRREAEEAKGEDEEAKAIGGARARAPRPGRGAAPVHPERSARPTGEGVREESPPAARERDDDDHVRHTDPNRDVLKRLFTPLTGRRPPRGEDQGDSKQDRARPRGETASPRGDSRPPAPSHPAPPRASAPPPREQERAVKRPPPKEREK